MPSPIPSPNPEIDPSNSCTVWGDIGRLSLCHACDHRCVVQKHGIWYCPDHPVLQIDHHGWQTLLPVDDNRLRARVVRLKMCGDITPRSMSIRPIFPFAEVVIVEDCDKNFVYYWLDTVSFPSVKQVWLFSHPCEPQVLHRFQDAQFYLEDQYKQFQRRWTDPKDTHIQLSSRQNCPWDH